MGEFVPHPIQQTRGRRSYDAIIVGGGPAGCAAGIQLARNRPGRADRILLIDAKVFPRDKLCGGGLVRESERMLQHLGVEPDGSSVSIHEVRFLVDDAAATIPKRDAFRVVRREEFDHALLQATVAAGVTVHQGEPVLRFGREADGIRVASDVGEYRAPVVIGADGAGSRVRRQLVGPALGERFIALEILTALDDPGRAHTAVFDFGPASRGLRGYAWEFPSLRSGEWIVNRGIGGSRWPMDRSLRDLFEEVLGHRGIALARHRLEGWSAPLYHPESPQSAPHVLLAGDAVGIDPWLGEGISVALGSGIVAAHAASEALADGDLRFAGYTERLRESGVGWQLCRKRSIADPFYEAASRAGGLAEWVGEGALP